MTVANTDVVRFVEQATLPFGLGLAIAHIIDAAAAEDKEIRSDHLRTARTLLEAEDGIIVEFKAQGGKLRVPAPPTIGKTKPKRAYTNRKVNPLDIPLDTGDTRKPQAGAHQYRCNTCGEMKHATAFFGGQRETCKKCKS